MNCRVGRARFVNKMNCLFSLSLSLVVRENRRGQGKGEREREVNEILSVHVNVYF
jgi:hypothetical protein